jgi:hypothetical protein
MSGKWPGDKVRDSNCMLLNLTNRFNIKAKNHSDGGLWCSSMKGPSFGRSELKTEEPFLGRGNVKSHVKCDGFMIPGKVGEINPLTGDTINKDDVFSYSFSESTALEIEVW